MTKVKHYYWLKLNKDFFIQPQIKKLRKIAGGDTYTIIFQKILLLSITSGGVVIYQGIESTIEEELALILDEDVDNIKITLTFMANSGLIEELSKNEFLIPSVVPLIGSETDAAERMRRIRAKKSVTLFANVQKSYTEKEIDKELEIEKDKKPHLRDGIGLEKNSKLELTPESEIKTDFCDNPDRVNKKNEALFDDNGFNETDKVAINNWLNYHKELKKPYKTKSGVTALRNKMLELAKNGLLIEAVNHSMAMGYTGLFPPNTKRYMPPNNNSPSLSSVIKNCNSQDFSSEEF